MSDTYIDIRKAFHQLFDGEPILVRAPGRINLIGEHTDYNDGFVMPAAIDKEIVFAVAESGDGTSTIRSLDMDESFSVDLDKVHKVGSPLWVNYLLGVIDRLQSKGNQLKPFNCVFGGNIPHGAGLSSSAALECGFIAALNTLNDLGESREDMIHMAQWAEHNYAGVKCGIMDQFSSMMGKLNHVFILDCRSLDYSYFPMKLNGYDILLLDTNVKHSLAGSEYNTRRRECEEGVAIFKKDNPSVNSLRDVSAALVRKYKGQLKEKVYDRCLYVTEEIERVQAASKDLEKGDLVAFGKKMFETHEGLSVLYEVSCPELDFLVDLVKGNKNVLGARMMGGGFGGCTINIVRSAEVDALIEMARNKYSEKFGIELKAYPVKLRDGVSLIDMKELVRIS